MWGWKNKDEKIAKKVLTFIYPGVILAKHLARGAMGKEKKTQKTLKKFEKSVDKANSLCYSKQAAAERPQQSVP